MKALILAIILPPVMNLYLRLLLLGLVLSTNKSPAQLPPLLFEHDWGPPGNMPGDNGRIPPWVMLQDQKGFLWFGTRKYDGNQFVHYKYDPLDSTSLSATGSIAALWEDASGLIWVGTAEATNRFDPRTETFTRLERSPANPFAMVSALAFNEDQEGNVWTANVRGELRIIDRKTGRYSSTDYASLLGNADKSRHISNLIRVIYRDKRGTLWMGSLTGLHQLVLTPQGEGKPSKVSFVHYRHDPANARSLSNNQVSSIYEDHKGVLWVGCATLFDNGLAGQGGLNAFDRKTGQFTRYAHEPAKLQSLSSNWITSLAEDPKGNLWVGTANGLNQLNPERSTWHRYQYDSLDAASLRSNYVGSLLMDRSGILWVSTNEGVDKLDTDQKPFFHYQHHASDPYSLSDNTVSALVEDGEGTLWIGTFGGVNAWDKKTKRFTHYRHDARNPYSLATDRVSALLVDREQNLWVANGQMLSRLDKQTGQFTHTQLEHPFMLPGDFADPVFAMCQDKAGQLWLATTNGILAFNPTTGATRSYTHTPYSSEGISDYWSLSVMEDKSGNLWIGNSSIALDKLDPKTGKFTHYRHDHGNPNSISSNGVKSLFEDSKGNLWLGTRQGGLCRFDSTTDTFTAYTEKQGLAGTNVYSILEDDAGNLWVGTEKGLSRFSPSEQTFTNYDQQDGLRDVSYPSTSAGGARCKGKDGTLYFGGMNGFIAFHPDSIRPNPYAPPVAITLFRLFDKPLPGKQESSQIELDYDQNFFSLEFAALSYRSPEKNQYAYQLEGVDKEWVYSGTRYLANYTDIEPGAYVFQVKAANNDGVWNQQGTAIRILIHPPFWRTYWAYSFYFLCLLAGIYAVHRYQRNRLLEKEREKARQRELEQAREIEKANQVLALQKQELAHQKEELQSTLEHLKSTQAQLVEQEKAALENEHKAERAAYQNRMTELEMQALRAQMNPHFIFNCLNSINRFILKNQSEAASDYLTKFSKLIRLILQNSQSQSVPLENELEALKLYLEMEMLRFEGRFHFQINAHPELEIEDLEVPPLIIQPYVENAIWHGLMHKEGQGHLSIDLRRENGTLLCQITDDGVGRKRAAEFKSKSASKGKSLGMQITSHRLALINSLNEKETTVQILDLVDPTGEACGTRVVVKIPV